MLSSFYACAIPIIECRMFFFSHFMMHYTYDSDCSDFVGGDHEGTRTEGEVCLPRQT